jgi:hypothetical protein
VPWLLHETFLPQPQVLNGRLYRVEKTLLSLGPGIIRQNWPQSVAGERTGKFQPAATASHVGRFFNKVRFGPPPDANQRRSQPRLTVIKSLADHAVGQHVKRGESIELLVLLNPADSLDCRHQVEHGWSTGAAGLDRKVRRPGDQP